jgi:hypothetical protein
MSWHPSCRMASLRETHSTFQYTQRSNSEEERLAKLHRILHSLAIRIPRILLKRVEEVFPTLNLVSVNHRIEYSFWKWLFSNVNCMSSVPWRLLYKVTSTYLVIVCIYSESSVESLKGNITYLHHDLWFVCRSQLRWSYLMYYFSLLASLLPWRWRYKFL